MTEARTGYSRTHVYLDNAVEPKHMFVVLADLIARRFLKDFSLLDVGAASGDFVAYASSRFVGMQALGVDFDPVLVESARRRVPQGRFEAGDANRLDIVGDGSFDVVTMTGTHSIFDDFRPSFGECIRAAKDEGLVLVTGIFNPYPVDALIHWRNAGRDDLGWHPGYNLFSHASVAAFLRAHPRVQSFEFVPFRIPFDVAPRQDDPIRSWTELSDSGQRVFRNGIMPLNFETLSVSVGRQ